MKSDYAKLVEMKEALIRSHYRRIDWLGLGKDGISKRKRAEMIEEYEDKIVIAKKELALLNPNFHV